MPLDFSSRSRKTLDSAVVMARQFKARLTVLHVVEPVAPPDFTASFPLAMHNDQVAAAAKIGLEGRLKEARVPRSMVETILVRFGRSYHEIVEVARVRKADLIVIATHGYAGVKHALLGSTTERVARHAHCPVLVVRQG